MPDLIDRAALLEKLELLAKHEDPFRETVIRGVMFTISDVTAVDAVEVVRCKDCKHSHNYPWGSYSCSFHEYEGEPHVEPDAFCSYGERKET